jgi:hypothetical protein
MDTRTHIYVDSATYPVRLGLPQDFEISETRYSSRTILGEKGICRINVIGGENCLVLIDNFRDHFQGD